MRARLECETVILNESKMKGIAGISRELHSTNRSVRGARGVRSAPRNSLRDRGCFCRSSASGRPSNGNEVARGSYSLCPPEGQIGHGIHSASLLSFSLR